MITIFFIIFICAQANPFRNILIFSKDVKINDPFLQFQAVYPSFLIGFTTELEACNESASCNLSFYLHGNVSLINTNDSNNVLSFSDLKSTNIIIRSFKNDSNIFFLLNSYLQSFEIGGKITFDNLIFLGPQNEIFLYDINNFYWPKQNQLRGFIKLKSGSELTITNCEFKEFYFFLTGLITSILNFITKQIIRMDWIHHFNSL